MFQAGDLPVPVIAFGDPIAEVRFSLDLTGMSASPDGSVSLFG
jgi:hypothetical protein